MVHVILRCDKCRLEKEIKQAFPPHSGVYLNDCKCGGSFSVVRWWY